MAAYSLHPDLNPADVSSQTFPLFAIQTIVSSKRALEADLSSLFSSDWTQDLRCLRWEGDIGREGEYEVAYGLGGCC